MNRRDIIGGALILLMATAIGYQYFGYSKALARAEAAEGIAKQSLKELKVAKADRAVSDLRAQQQLAALDSRVSAYEALLAKGSRTHAVPAKLSPQQEAASAAPSVSGGPPGASYGPNKQWPDVCDAFQKEDGTPLVIGAYPVYVCGLASYVAAQSAIDLVKAGGELEALHTRYDGVFKELTATQDALQKTQTEAVAYKKAAKKSGIKRFLGAVEKVGLFAAGAILGRVIP